jgi:pimeloyl-ACP methyl ester carboxylesterase
MILHSKITGQGKPFLILHGFLGMGDNWKTLGTKFSKLGHEVHLIDQRNHGRSFHSKEFNYEVMSDDLKAYCDCHEIEQCILMGHSMGGKTAMLFASNHPEMIDKLIVADISPRFYPQHHQVILKALSALDFDMVRTRKVANDVLAEYISDPGVRQFLAKNLYWKFQDKLALRINLPVLIENIEEIGKPLEDSAQFNGDTLFLRGAISDYIQSDDEQLIRKHFAKAEIKTISNAGHWLHAENPSEFYEVVSNFISL